MANAVHVIWLVCGVIDVLHCFRNETLAYTTHTRMAWLVCTRA